MRRYVWYRPHMTLQQPDYNHLQETLSIYTHMLCHIFSNISRDYSSHTRKLLNSTLLQGLIAIIADNVTSKLGNVITPKTSGHCSVVTFYFKSAYMQLLFIYCFRVGWHVYIVTVTPASLIPWYFFYFSRIGRKLLLPLDVCLSVHRCICIEKKKPTRCHWMIYCTYSKWSEFLATDTEVSGSIPGATRFSE